MPAEHAERFGKVPLEGIGEGVNERACDEASDFVGRQERGNMSHDRCCELLHRHLREFGAFILKFGGLFSVA